MKKISLVLTIFFVFCLIINSGYTQIQLGENETTNKINETPKFNITFKKVYDGIIHKEYIVNITNLVDEDIEINPTVIFANTNFPLEEIKNVYVYEYVPIPKEVPTYDTKEVKRIYEINKSDEKIIIPKGCSQINETHYECLINETYQNGTTTKNILGWKPYKPTLEKKVESISIYDEENKEISVKEELISDLNKNLTISKLDTCKYDDLGNPYDCNKTKTFKIVFDTPITKYKEGWGSKGLLAVGDYNTKFYKHPWWDSSWLYRKPITVSEQSGSNLTNYQVRLNIDTETPISEDKMDIYCRDIRFVDDDSSTELYYYITEPRLYYFQNDTESGCNTTNACDDNWDTRDTHQITTCGNIDSSKYYELNYTLNNSAEDIYSITIYAKIYRGAGTISGCVVGPWKYTYTDYYSYLWNYTGNKWDYKYHIAGISSGTTGDDDSTGSSTVYISYTVDYPKDYISDDGVVRTLQRLRLRCENCNLCSYCNLYMYSYEQRIEVKKVTERNCNTNNTEIFVKLNLTANNNKTIYMYYGNPSATSESNGSAVFDFFDDFEDGDYSDKWTLISGTASETNGYLEVSSTSLIEGLIEEKVTQFSDTNGFIVEGKIMQTTTNDLGEILIHGDHTDNNWYIFTVGYSNELQIVKKVSGSGTTLASVSQTINENEWYDFRVTRKPDGTIVGEIIGVNSVSATDTSLTSGYVGIRVGGKFSDTCRVDNYRVRKYADPEPTYSIGEEEQPDTTPPTILSINYPPSLDPIENSNSTLILNFTASDENLNDSSAQAIIKIDSTTHINTSCIATTINSTTKRYDCNIDLTYYDKAGSWNINVSICDTSNNCAYNDSNNFTYNQLKAFIVNTSLIDFGTFHLTDPNITRTLKLTNTGNVNITQINVTGYDLVGVINNNYKLLCSDNIFKVNEQYLINNTAITVQGAYIDVYPNDNYYLNFTLIPTNIPVTTISQEYKTLVNQKWLITI